MLRPLKRRPAFGFRAPRRSASVQARCRDREGRTTMAETKIDVAPPRSVAVATTRSIELTEVATRSEHDLLGDTDVPADAYWGVHTLRAVDNFPITGVPVGHFPDLVRALAMV